MVNTQVRPAMKLCFSDYFRNLVFTLSANGAIKTQKDLSFPVLGRSRLKTIAQKIKFYRVELFFTMILFTVNNLCLLFIQF